MFILCSAHINYSWRHCSILHIDTVSIYVRINHFSEHTNRITKKNNNDEYDHIKNEKKFELFLPILRH